MSARPRGRGGRILAALSQSSGRPAPSDTSGPNENATLQQYSPQEPQQQQADVGHLSASMARASLSQAQQRQSNDDYEHLPSVRPAAAPPTQAGPSASSAAPLARGFRGRGAALFRQQSSRQPSGQPQQHQQQQQQQAASSSSSSSSQRSDSPNSNGQHTPGRVSRSGSDLSSASVASAAFGVVEDGADSNIRPPLVKEPSTAGQQIQLALNYLKFDIENGQNVQEYHVIFEPNIESIQLRYKVLRSDEARAIIGSTMQWSGTNLFLPIKLAQRTTCFCTSHPTLQGQQLQVKLIFVKTPPQEELIPFYNVLMRKVMNSLKMVLINRHYYSQANKLLVPQHKLEIWPGWVTSIQTLDGGVKLSCDASFRILRTQTALEALVDIRNRSREFKIDAERALVGAIVMTKYNSKAYRVDDLDFVHKPTSTFVLEQGQREITYVEYFKEHWNIDIKDRNQPLLINRPRLVKGQTEQRMISLIPELCVITGLSDELRSDFSVMREIANHTRIKPDMRYQKLCEFINTIHTSDKASAIFADWNLSISPTPDEVTGRRLPNETLLFGQSRTVDVPDNADWTRPATNMQALVGVHIKDWILVYTDRDSSTADNMLQCLKQCATKMGFKFDEPRQVRLSSDQSQVFVNSLRNEVKSTDQLVVMITPGKGQREDRYNACKRLLSCDMPVPSQFVRAGTLSNPGKARSVCMKVAIQILSKVGGQPWGIKVPLKSFMVVGIDVYHDTLDKKKSCVGFVASTNATVSQWYSRTFFQNTFEEICAKLKHAFVDAIKRFQQLNGGLVPEKIFVYRDGVGDGQLDTVLQIELPQVMDGIKFYSKEINSFTPQISYLVIQKKISAKLIMKRAGIMSNPLPGSYLDHTITHPHYNDFYLISQHVEQGTVSPTKYIVLSDTASMKIEHHQRLAYKMTHMYYNWCGTVRVPAPCQYAHKLAYLVGQNIRQDANERLSSKLFYL